MNRLRLTDAKSEVAVVAGKCEDDAEVIQLINEAQRRLCTRGRWVGTVQRYRVAVTDANITWPRQVKTVEAIAFCEEPGHIRNEWYEFLGYGPGMLDADSARWYNLVDRGQVCIHTDITAGATNRKVRVYADVTEAALQYITIQGYDENSNWIRTQFNGDWIDGEKVLISTTPQLSTKKFTAITGIIKPITNGAVRLYEYNTDTAANVQAIGYYEPDETTPVYRRSLLPGIEDMETCGTTEEHQVTVAVKLRCIPVRNDDDWLLIGNLDAIKLGVQAILKERKDLQGEAEGYWGKAITELQHELKEYQGDGAIPAPKIAPDFGGGSIVQIY